MCTPPWVSTAATRVPPPGIGTAVIARIGRPEGLSRPTDSPVAGSLNRTAPREVAVTRRVRPSARGAPHIPVTSPSQLATGSRTGRPATASHNPIDPLSPPLASRTRPSARGRAVNERTRSACPDSGPWTSRPWATSHRHTPPPAPPPSLAPAMRVVPPGRDTTVSASTALDEPGTASENAVIRPQGVPSAATEAFPSCRRRAAAPGASPAAASRVGSTAVGCGADVRAGSL